MMYLVAILLPMIAMASKKLSSTHTLGNFKNGKVVASWEEKQSNLRLEALPTQKPGRAWQIEYVGDSCDEDNILQYVAMTTNKCISHEGRSSKIECSKGKDFSFFFFFYRDLFSSCCRSW
jgi:hypothetical protein